MPEMRRPEPDEPTTSGETAAPPSDLDAEVAAHQSCSCLAPDGRAVREHCLECEHAWPCLVRRLAQAHADTEARLRSAHEYATLIVKQRNALQVAHADCTNLSAAEAFRIFEEAREQRERAEQGEAERDELAAIVGVECPIADLSIVESLRVASAHAGQYAEEMERERDAAAADLDTARARADALLAEVRTLRPLVREYAGLIESDYPLTGHYGEQHRRARMALGEATP
jgi:hypothetical protein